MPHLTKLDHFAIAVKDLQTSVQWYKRVLQLEELPNPGWGAEPVFLLADNDSGVAIFSKSAGNPLEPGAGLPHFAFAANRENYKLFKAHLNAENVKWEEQDHIISHSIYFRDPDDYKIEITTYEV